MKILITGSSGFIGFHLTKLFLEKKHKVHGYDSMNNYYDVKLKKARLNILKKYHNFSFTQANLENEKMLKGGKGKQGKGKNTPNKSQKGKGKPGKGRKGNL